MKISELKHVYPLIHAKAVEYAKAYAKKEGNFFTEDKQIDQAFPWSETVEKSDFWLEINRQKFTEAKKREPELFKPRKFGLGPIKFKTNDIRIPTYTADSYDIPRELIQHGDTVFQENKGEIVAFHNDYYIVRFLDIKNNYVQVGFKEDVLESLTECWCVEYSSDFTEDMFKYLVMWCSNKYGPYKREVVPLSWKDFQGKYPFFWVNSRDSHLYSQDNHRASCPIITLDELLKKIDYKAPKPLPKKAQVELEQWDEEEEEWDYEEGFINKEPKSTGIVIPPLNLVSSKANLQLRRVPNLSLKIAKKEFNQVQIIIKPNHVKV